MQLLSFLNIHAYQLTPSSRSQLGLFEDVQKIDGLTTAADEINERYGLFTVYSATSVRGTKIVKQKITSGGMEYIELLLKRA